MKHLRTLILSLAGAATLAAAANAAAMKPADRIRPWLGTWSCKAAGNNHTATFTPVFGGSGMRIAETGKMPSEEIVIFDSKRSKWIDQYTDATGAYNTMEGTPSGNTIRFTQVYPAANTVLTVTMPSKNEFRTTFTGTMNGKTMTQREVCTRT